jgi:pyruvate/2-oxoglutarate dehydrogenase complex dihydrolipoamide acyltransferase (E2) component
LVQACILAVGGTETRVIPNPAKDATDPFVTAQYMNVTLSCDHRVVRRQRQRQCHRPRTSERQWTADPVLCRLLLIDRFSSIYALGLCCGVALMVVGVQVDGAVGAQWMSAFKGFMEDPQTMLL